eukprot:scaffold1052_cov17-Tisochrysis_lutea.AAC.1
MHRMYTTVVHALLTASRGLYGAESVGGQGLSSLHISLWCHRCMRLGRGWQEGFCLSIIICVGS